MIKTKNDIAWSELFKKYYILEEIDKYGQFEITSTQINEFREARLMTKFDFRNHLPTLFKNNKLSILPISRGTYILSRFDAYKDFEEASEGLISMPFPEYIESIEGGNITSESIALNCAYLSSIISDFMGEDGVLPTVSGRMSSSAFNFNIAQVDGSTTIPLQVKNAQIEIDGGFEGYESLALIEAKNVVSSDFIIRQLYYPFRLWKTQIRKKVRPMFLTYSNDIFSMYEYDFFDPDNYNSLELVKQKNYIIGTDDIVLEDIIKIFRTIKIVEEPLIPFPQADSFPRIINLCEELLIQDLGQEDIYTMFDIQPRQADYYANAGRYLNLIERYNVDSITMYRLTDTGKAIMGKRHKEKQLGFVQLILQHSVFHEVMEIAFRISELPDKNTIVGIMHNNYIHNVESEVTYRRRASTISSWVNWVLNLITR